MYAHQYLENNTIGISLHDTYENVSTHHYDHLEHVNDVPQCDYLSQSPPSCSPDHDYITQHPESKEIRAEDINEWGLQHDYRAVPSLINSPFLDNAQKMSILTKCTHPMLNRLYEQYMATHGIQKPSTASTFPPKDGDLTEENYQPLVTSNEPLPDPEAPRPVYPAYTGYFMSAHDAKAYRKRIRITPKEHAPDVERVKQYGRQYWVRRIYEAMIDVTAISDGDSSIHRLRFTGTPGFDPQDLEAVAHHVFDSALAVHERGWNRPKIYHKKVVRGKLADVSEKSLETRLARICLCLKQKKATVDDAIRGGVTLALLCDNPEARGFTKVSNNTGNKKRGERLRLAKGTDQNGQQQQQQHSGED